jgi:hypothetical protein
MWNAATRHQKLLRRGLGTELEEALVEATGDEVVEQLGVALPGDLVHQRTAQLLLVGVCNRCVRVRVRVCGGAWMVSARCLT